MFKKCCQRLRHQVCAVLFGIVLISVCTVSAGAVFTEGSGEGQVLYGSTILPDFSSNYGGNFPYVVIGLLQNQAWTAMIFTQEPLIYNDGLYLSAGTSYGTFVLSSGQWVNYDYNTVQSPSVVIPSITSVLTHVWSLSDVYDISDPESPVLAYTGTDPFPLDGYNYIEWDGDTTGLDEFYGLPWSNYYYFGVPDFDSTVYERSYELIINPADPNYYRFVSVSPVEDRDTYGYDFSVSNSRMSAFVRPSLSRAGTDAPGLYLSRFPINPINYDKYFIYPVPSDASIDFSSTSLTASNPQYDYQSAEFDVSWSNLPVIPYPDNIQYFILGRLNDGSSSQPPEIYLGSSSDPPTSNVPVSFSFTNLQPETQYTATFEIVYNTTGTFRDFIRSGVTTTVSFTTLSDGSISEGDKAIINAIQNANKDNQQWTDSQFGSAVGDLPQDTTETDNLISGLDQQEEAYKDEAYDRFQELSTAFSGFDGSVGSGIGLAGTLFSRFFNALGSYKIIYTFPLLLGLAMVLIGRLGRSSIRMEREPGDQFKIDGW